MEHDIKNENDTSENLKRKRSGKKSVITRKINQVNLLIENNGNKSFIKHALIQLDEAWIEVENIMKNIFSRPKQ